MRSCCGRRIAARPGNGDSRWRSSFGSPAFLNFGRNYAGARDGYVYTYSQDGPSAYESDNGVMLARVPKERIRERGAWEFYERLDAAGRPVGRRTSTRRGAVFAYPGGLPAGRRGLQCGAQAISDGSGIRSCGRMGAVRRAGAVGSVDDAFCTASGTWRDARISAAGEVDFGRRATMTLVFSGVKPNDAFCTRVLKLTK